MNLYPVITQKVYWVDEPLLYPIITQEVDGVDEPLHSNNSGGRWGR